jgi:hypothetical protein
VTLTNIAGLVYETEFATQYQYAISCCEQAIALVDSYQDFPYPTHFLYLIRIRMTAVEELEELMAQLRISYPVGKQSLRALIQTVDDDKKRGLLMECLLPVRET